MGIGLSEFFSHVRFNRFIGLSVYLTDAGFEVAGCEISKNKGDLRVVNEFRFSGGFSELSSLVSGRFPVFLVVDGKGVLHKKLALDRSSDILAAFPDIDPKSFHVQKSGLRQGTAFVSICRKELISELLKDLSSAGFGVMSCALGPFVVDAFLEFISVEGGGLHLGYAFVKVDEGGVLSVARTEMPNREAIVLQTESMGADVLVGFCFVLGHFSGASKTTGVLDFPELDHMVEDAKFKRKYYQILGFGLVGMLLILFINFLFYTGFASEINQMEGSYYRNSEMLKQLGLLEADFQKKRMFVENNELLGHSVFAQFCDQMGSSVPEDIVLEKMDVNPILGKIRNGKRIKYLKGVAVIEGEAKHDNSLSRWVQLLGKKDWVKEVIIEKYKYEPDGHLSFALKVEIGKGGEHEEL